jgi:L-lactate dehydrogenase complex protein LldE
MRIGLFIPCYIDAFVPEVGIATLEFVTPARPDECCGFGGTFSMFEEVVSTKMGCDKVSDHARAGAKYIVSADTSCLMHQHGCAERIGVPIKFIHIAQIPNGAAE